MRFFNTTGPVEPERHYCVPPLKRVKLRRSVSETVAEGLRQTAGHMDKSAADSGHLVVFDRDEDKPWSAKIFHRVERVESVAIHIWGM